MPDLFMLHLCQLFSQRPTLRSLGITQAELDQQYQGVLDHYCEQLILFFTQPKTRTSSRWGRLAQMLEQHLHIARYALGDVPLHAMISDVLSYPDSGERDYQLGERSPHVYLVRRHDCLALAISLTGFPLVVYSLTRGFETLDDASLPDDAERLEHDVFEEWALGALDGILQRVAQIDPARFSDLDALDRQLKQVSRPSDFIEHQRDHDRLRHELEQQLPTWLKDAAPLGRLAYSQWLEALARFHEASEGATDPADFASRLALQLRRQTLECWLQGKSSVTYKGYRLLRAALKKPTSQRRLHGASIVFRPLLDGSGYRVGPSTAVRGDWLIVRPEAAQVIEQVSAAPEAGAPLSEPLSVLSSPGEARWRGLLETPLDTLARLKQIGGNLQGKCPAAPAWQCEVSLLRNLALLLVYPGTEQSGAPGIRSRRVKRMDSAWAGTGEDLSVMQGLRLEGLRRPALTSLGDRIRDGVHKGLQWMGDVLVYNKDENHYTVLSDNRICFKCTVVEHQLVDRAEQPTQYGPYIARDASDEWQLIRSPRLRRSVDRKGPTPPTGSELIARLPELLDAATRQSRVAGTLPVEVEEALERHARNFNGAARALENAGGDAAQVRQLDNGAQQLRAQGRYLRIDMIRHTPTPTVGDVQYLLAQKVIRIRRIDGRVAETIDGQVDYLQEYEVQDLTDGNKPLWYAHFHYKTLQGADDHPTKAHLKTAAQRRLGRTFERCERADGRCTAVYRGPITNAAGRQLFLGAASQA